MTDIHPDEYVGLEILTDICDIDNQIIGYMTYESVLNISILSKTHRKYIQKNNLYKLFQKFQKFRRQAQLLQLSTKKFTIGNNYWYI